MATLDVDARDFKRAAEALEHKHFKALADQTIGAVLVNSANIARRHIRSKAASHRRTGKMAGRIQYTKKGAGLEMEVRLRAGGPIAHLLEGGVAPHEEVARGGSGGAQLGGSGAAMTIRGAGASSGALSGFGSRVVRASGAGVLALRRVVHHPGNAAAPFFQDGINEAQPEIQARIDKGADTMKRNLEFALSGRGGKK